MSTTNDQVHIEQGSEINRLRETAPQPADATKEFRDLVVDPPQPPWRLTIDPPLDFDGQSFSELIFDFDGMIAKDFVRAERTFNHTYRPDKNEGAILPEMHHEYQIILAAQVANVPIGLIYKLPRRYYNPVRLQALKACGSSPDEDKA